MSDTHKKASDLSREEKRTLLAAAGNLTGIAFAKTLNQEK